MQKRFVPDKGGVFPEWEEVEFGKLFQRRSEKNGKEFGVEKTISVATMHFKPEGNKAADESLPKYRVLRKGDIAYEGNKSKHFKHGRFVLNDIGDGIISPIFEVLQPVSELSKEVPEFWKYYINYEPVMGKILAKCANTGIMMNRLAVKDFYKQKIKVPCIEEQRKIAAALAAYDEMIAVKTAKLETWQECKKRMVKEIFGRTKRFKDDDGREFPEWEEKTLGEVAEILKNNVNPQNNKNDSFTEYSMPAYDNEQTAEVMLGAAMKSSRKKMTKPVVLVNKLNVRKKRVWKVSNPESNAVCSAEFVPLASDDMDLDFLQQLCETDDFTKYLMKNTTGTANSLQRVRPEVITDYTFKMPCMEEQQKIGSFLAEIDKEIEIQKEFIKTYAEGKKRMMRELME